MELRQLALNALSAADVSAKLAAVAAIAADTALDVTVNIGTPSGLPGRPARPKLVAATDVPRRGIGSREGRAALIHALAHIEFNAIKTVYNECHLILLTQIPWQRLTATFDFQALAKRLVTR